MQSLTLPGDEPEKKRARDVPAARWRGHAGARGWSKYEDRLGEIRQLFRKGLGMSAVATLMGTDRNTLRLICNAFDIPVPERGWYFSEWFKNLKPILGMNELPGMLPPPPGPKIKRKKIGATQQQGRHTGSARVVEIKAAICKRFDLSPADLISPRKMFEISHPRQLAMLLTREETRLSLPAIGRSFGRKDHTTVIHGIEAAKARIANSAEWRDHYTALKIELTMHPANDEAAP